LSIDAVEVLEDSLVDKRPRRPVYALLRARVVRQVKRLRSGEAREYHVWRITLPRDTVEELGLEPGYGEELLLAALRLPDWYHLYDYNDPVVRTKIWPRLPRRAKLELCAWKIAPRELCGDMEPVTLLLPREMLERLGLHPGDTLTFEDIKKALRMDRGMRNHTPHCP